MRPTQRAVLVFGAGVPLSLMFVLYDDRLWVLGAAYLGIAVLLTGSDGVLALPGRRLRISVNVPDLLFIGDEEELTVDLSVPSWRGRATIHAVCDVGADLGSPGNRIVTLRAGAPAKLAFSLRPERRGTAEVHRIWLRWSGPLGLMSKHRVEPVAAAVPVVPNIRAVRTAALQFFTRDAMFGIKAQRQQGDGSDFDALRDYLPGLDHRSIDWKHSARHRKLVCKEFQTERNHQIILAFDTGQLMSEPLAGIPKLDHAINAGLMLAYFSLRGGDRVGLFGFDSIVRLYAEPVGGLNNFTGLQHASAGLSYRAEETNFTLGLANLLTRLNRRSLVVVLTEFVDTITAELMVENLQRLATRHLVVFVTLQDPSLRDAVDLAPRSFGHVARSVVADEFIRERAVVFERLRRHGIHCLDAPDTMLSVDLLNRYLHIKQRELI